MGAGARQVRLSGSRFRRKKEHGLFCTENSEGYTLSYVRITAWPEISRVVSRDDVSHRLVISRTNS